MSTTEVREAEIPVALRHAEQAVNELSRIVEELISRLRPVMNGQEHELDPGPAMVTNCPLAGEIYGLARKVQESRAILEGVLAQLEL